MLRQLRARGLLRNNIYKGVGERGESYTEQRKSDYTGAPHKAQQTSLELWILPIREFHMEQKWPCLSAQMQAVPCRM